jgi:endonuclease III
MATTGRASRVSRTALPQAIASLRKLYGVPQRPPTRDPFGLVIYENVVYLASPERRREAFEELRSTVGTSPEAILGAPRSVLKKIAARGIIASRVASRIQDCARIAVEEFGGDVAAAVAGGMKDAIRALRRFPGIGQPGAEKILLFAGRPAGLAPESNGLRVLVRLGLAREEPSYARTYAAGRAAGSALRQKAAALQEAHLLLQLHGQTLCRNKAPACDRCPVARSCAHALGLADSSPPRVGSRRR